MHDILWKGVNKMKLDKWSLLSFVGAAIVMVGTLIKSVASDEKLDKRIRKIAKEEYESYDSNDEEDI